MTLEATGLISTNATSVFPAMIGLAFRQDGENIFMAYIDENSRFKKFNRAFRQSSSMSAVVRPLIYEEIRGICPLEFGNVLLNVLIIILVFHNKWLCNYQNDLANLQAHENIDTFSSSIFANSGLYFCFQRPLFLFSVLSFVPVP